MEMTHLEINHIVTNRCDIFQLKGRIDGNTAPDFEAAVHTALDANRFHLVLTLSGVEYMSSAALRVLISTSKECRKFNRGDVRLAECNERVLEVLNLAGLVELFKMYETETEAVGSY